MQLPKQKQTPTGTIAPAAKTTMQSRTHTTLEPAKREDKVS